MKKNLTNVIGYIYKLTSPNGKIYIGQTINKKQRIYNYKKSSFKNQIKLWNNCNKYDWNPADSFEMIEECLCGENKCYLNEREKYWVQYFDSFKNGLNCNEGGHGNIGHKHSDESRKKMSESAKKNIEKLSIRAKKTHSGRIQSDEEKQKKSIKLKGIKRNDEFKNKMRIIAKNRIISDETKNKISKAKKNTVSKKREKICQLDLDGKLIKIWDHAKDAETKLKITKGKISAVCLGNRKTTGGFKWKYLKNYEMD
jgi:group I intron endonuclease